MAKAYKLICWKQRGYYFDEESGRAIAREKGDQDSLDPREARTLERAGMIRILGNADELVPVVRLELPPADSKPKRARKRGKAKDVDRNGQ